MVAVVRIAAAGDRNIAREPVARIGIESVEMVHGADAVRAVNT